MTTYAILGTGTVGTTLATRLLELGHDVVLGTRDPDATRRRDGWDPALDVRTFAAAADAGEVVIHASSGAAALDVITAAGAALDGKVVLDVSNPLDFSAGFPPTLSVKDTDSLAEQLQRAVPSARVVKALNTVAAPVMVHPERLPEPTTLFVSGDDADAKATVAALLAELGHRDVIDLGDLSTARGTEMYLALWVRTMGALGTADFNVRVVR
jgi:8-hydroxy-5-deazaflavin:NADPH oxidoreductase